MIGSKRDTYCEMIDWLHTVQSKAKEFGSMLDLDRTFTGGPVANLQALQDQAKELNLYLLKNLDLWKMKSYDHHYPK